MPNLSQHCKLGIASYESTTTLLAGKGSHPSLSWMSIQSVGRINVCEVQIIVG